MLIKKIVISGDFPCLKVHLKFKRNFGHHLIQTYLPTVLIVTISWVSFFLEAGAVPARGMLSFKKLSKNGRKMMEINLPSLLGNYYFPDYDHSEQWCQSGFTACFICQGKQSFLEKQLIFKKHFFPLKMKEEESEFWLFCKKGWTLYYCLIGHRYLDAGLHLFRLFHSMAFRFGLCDGQTTHAQCPQYPAFYLPVIRWTDRRIHL
jgi:hypothetical protein